MSKSIQRACKRMVFAATLLVLSIGTVRAVAQSTSQTTSGSAPDAPQPPAKSQSAASAASKDKGRPLPTAPTPAANSSTPPATAPVSTTDQAPAAPKPSTAGDNPFPEDISRKAEADAKTADKNAATPNAPTPATPGTSSSRDDLDKLGMDDPSRKQLKVASPDGTADVYNPKRAAEDVNVGQFYLKRGDYKGAYARFKDAATFDHEDVEAVFWVAEAARKLNLSDEALQNYQVYLNAVPDGPNARAAKKALNELVSSKKQ